MILCVTGLEVNRYNRDKCVDAFTAYKECKKQEVRQHQFEDVRYPASSVHHEVETECR